MKLFFRKSEGDKSSLLVILFLKDNKVFMIIFKAIIKKK